MTKRNLCDTCLHRAVCRHGIAQQWGRMQPSEADVRIAFELLNYRSNDKSLLTIISSELSLDEIADIDEAIAGRIAQHAAGHCVTVAPDRGKNYRLKGVVSL